MSISKTWSIYSIYISSISLLNFNQQRGDAPLRAAIRSKNLKKMDLLLAHGAIMTEVGNSQ
jgi:hypothetical protein